VVDPLKLLFIYMGYYVKFGGPTSVNVSVHRGAENYFALLARLMRDGLDFFNTLSDDYLASYMCQCLTNLLICLLKFTLVQ